MYFGKGRTNLIRGISRQIIEVQKLGNEYFERALFFVNPVFSDAERSVLEKEARRILRDVCERGRTMESVINQYITTVKPMHEEFVEPSKKYADVIIPEGGFNSVAVAMLIQNIRSLIAAK